MQGLIRARDYKGATMTTIAVFNDLSIVQDTKGRIVITDDFMTDYVTFYGNGQWACDGVFGYNRDTIGIELCLELDKIAKVRGL